MQPFNLLGSPDADPAVDRRSFKRLAVHGVTFGDVVLPASTSTVGSVCPSRVIVITAAERPDTGCLTCVVLPPEAT